MGGDVFGNSIKRSRQSTVAFVMFTPSVLFNSSAVSLALIVSIAIVTHPLLTFPQHDFTQ